MSFAGQRAHLFAFILFITGESSWLRFLKRMSAPTFNKMCYTFGNQLVFNFEVPLPLPWKQYTDRGFNERISVNLQTGNKLHPHQNMEWFLLAGSIWLPFHLHQKLKLKLIDVKGFDVYSMFIPYWILSLYRENDQCSKKILCDNTVETSVWFLPPWRSRINLCVWNYLPL